MSEETNKPGSNLPPPAPQNLPQPAVDESAGKKRKRIVVLVFCGFLAITILLSYFKKPSVEMQKRHDAIVAKETMDAIARKKLPKALQTRELTAEEQGRVDKAGQSMVVEDERKTIAGGAQTAATGGEQEKTLAQLIAEESKKRELKARFDDSIVESTGKLQMSQLRAGPVATEERVMNPINTQQAPATPVTAAAMKKVVYDDNTLPEGTFFDCTLVNKLNGDNTGPVKCSVAGDVYIPGTRKVVIPQGSFVLGESTKVNAFGQARLAVAFHRVQVGIGAPGAYAISLDGPGLDQQGAGGLHDRVNNHYASIFGSALAVGAIGALAQLGNGQGNYGYDPSVQMRNGISQSMSQSADRILERFLNRLPTIEIRPGTPIRIWLTGDLAL